MKRKDKGDYEEKNSSDCGGCTCSVSFGGMQRRKRAEGDGGYGSGKYCRGRRPGERDCGSHGGHYR